MRTFYTIHCLLLFVPIFLTAGCAHIPVAATAQYTDAFRDVSAVTRDLLDDYSAALDVFTAQDKKADQQQKRYPLLFDPEVARSSEAPPPMIAGFENALRAIEEYNAALLARADGADDEAIAARAAAIGNFISSSGIVPAGLPIADIAHEVLAMLSRANDRKEFETTLRNGKPLIEKLLQGFENATADFYRVRVGLVGAAITEIEFKQQTVLDAIEDIAGTYALPPAATELSLQRAQLETEIALLRAEITPSHAARPLPVGLSPYEADAHARIEEQVRVQRGLCADRRALMDGLSLYHTQLGEYVRLLEETKQYFDALVRATGSREAAVRAQSVSMRAGKLRTEMRRTRITQSLPISTDK